MFGCHRNKEKKLKKIYNKKELPPIENINNDNLNNLLLVTLSLRKQLKELSINYNKLELENEKDNKLLSSWGFDSLESLDAFIKKYKKYECSSKHEKGIKKVNNINKNRGIKENNVKKEKENKFKSRTNISINRYYNLGLDILNKKDTLNNLIKNFGNEKNIYKVKSRALRIVEYVDILKKNNINNISITLKKIFNFTKIEFNNYIKNIPLNIHTSN